MDFVVIAGVKNNCIKLPVSTNKNINEEDKIPKWLYVLILVAGVLYLLWLLFIKEPGPQRKDFPFFRSTS